jgi:hypothetical protein
MSDKKVSFENTLTGADRSGLIAGPGSTPLIHHAGAPNYPRGTTAADYLQPNQEELYRSALKDALMFLRDTNVDPKSLLWLIPARNPGITRKVVQDAIAQAQAVIAVEKATAEEKA